MSTDQRLNGDVLPPSSTESSQKIIEVRQQSSLVTTLLWLLALALFLGSVFVGSELAAYWQPASNIWVRTGIIFAMIVSGLFLLWFTPQGKSFVQLLKDARVELRRITWPTKAETIHITWIVIVVVCITALFLSGVDLVFAKLIKLIIG